MDAPEIRIVEPDTPALLDAAREIFREYAQGLGGEVQVLETAHIGDCANGPEIMVYPDEVHYAGLKPEDIPFLVQEHLVKGRVVGRLLSTVTRQTDEELGPPRPKEVRVVVGWPEGLKR